VLAVNAGTMQEQADKHTVNRIEMENNHDVTPFDLLVAGIMMRARDEGDRKRENLPVPTTSCTLPGAKYRGFHFER
jgi:hypothetical protein